MPFFLNTRETFCLFTYCLFTVYCCLVGKKVIPTTIFSFFGKKNYK